MNVPEPLDVALAAQRPIATDREELEIERLIPAHQRRVSVDDHAAWRESLAPPAAGDELQEIEADREAASQ